MGYFKSNSQITLLQPVPNSEPVQGHNITLTGGWNPCPDLFPLSKFDPILPIIQQARYDPPGYISHPSLTPISRTVWHKKDERGTMQASGPRGEMPE